MQIDHIQTGSAALAALGIDAARLLVGNVNDLVERFGYGRALGRNCADAVRADLAATLAEPVATAPMSEGRQEPHVS